MEMAVITFRDGSQVCGWLLRKRDNELVMCSALTPDGTPDVIRRYETIAVMELHIARMDNNKESQK